jgi:NADH-quinone oxidoreductase subunit L
MNTMPPSLLWYIPLLPFAGFVLNGTIGRRLPRAAVTAIALFFTAVPAAIVLWLWQTMLSTGRQTMSVTAGPWIAITGFHVDFTFAVDHLTMIMLAVVTGVGFLIHIYSAGYMAHEDGYWRFFAYLNLFMFFMSVLVLAESFLLLFVGWEGVGLASYLLIGFYFKKRSASDAGKKAFIVNRIGDFGFLLAMFLIIEHFGSLSFGEVFAKIAASPLHGGILTAIALLLVVGATGKSAQIPLYIWLPDAMEGPTPVSALIHAATMVTAGVYMVARCHTLFDRSPYALGVVAIIGALTAFFAALVGIVQNDIKRVLAYSTISQLGYMFLACGAAAYSAAIFHLVTHAFFKALLFLAAGSVIHALSGEQDMRVMGGLRKRIPVTFWTMTMGVFAIAGLPPFAGFFSKDEILYRVFSDAANPAAKLLWAVGLITAGITSFYMFRLWFKTFFGAPRFEDQHALAEHGAAVHASSTSTLTLAAEHDDAQTTHKHSVHESPWVMLAPLAVLAILSVVGGWIGIPQALGGNNAIEHFLDPVFAATGSPENALNADQVSHGLELGLAAVSVVTALLGLFVAWFLYVKKPGSSTAIVKKLGPVYTLVEHKFYVDEIYNAVFVTFVMGFTRIILYGLGDRITVDGVGKIGSWMAMDLGEGARRLQSGNLRSYAGWLALGAAVVMAVMIFGFGHLGIAHAAGVR